MKNKKITTYIIACVTIFLVGIVFYVLSKNDLFGIRVNFDVHKVETNVYESFTPDISFKYPAIFEVDNDDQNKYGSEYLVGIKLKTDTRTGCDVRVDGPELDFSKGVDEIASMITKDISENAKNFKIVEKKKVSIDGRDGFKVAFSFLDPIGAYVQLEQVFVKNDDINYFIICGTGEYQYEFFQKDFDVFFDSIEFDRSASDLERQL